MPTDNKEKKKVYTNKLEFNKANQAYSDSLNLYNANLQFDIDKNNSAHKQTQIFRGNNKKEDFNNFSGGQPNSTDKAKLALYGILNRSFNNTIDYMQNINGKNLFGLGKKINEMLKDEKLKENLRNGWS